MRGIWASADVPDPDVTNEVRSLTSHALPRVAAAAKQASESTSG